jgi:hypothetical protein
MNPFYALNKTLDDIRNEPTKEQKELVESQAPKSPAKKTLEEALRTDLRSLMEDATGGLSGGNTLEGYPPVMTPSDEKYKQALARVYGQQILRNPKFPDLLARLKRSTPNERDLDLIIRNGTLPNHLEEADMQKWTVEFATDRKSYGDAPDDLHWSDTDVHATSKEEAIAKVKAKNPRSHMFSAHPCRENHDNLDEAKDKSLSQAAKTVKKGALHKQEGIPQDKKIGDKKLNSLKKSGTPLEKKRANFALNIQGKGKKKVKENMGMEECGMGGMEEGATPDELTQQTIMQKNRAAATRKNSRAVQQQLPQGGPRRSEIPAFIRKGRGDPALDHNDLEETNMYSESDKDILDYLKAKLAPAGKATSRPYNGSAGDADAYNGMEFEDDEGTGKFDKREISPGRTQYTRKANTFVDVNDPDQKSASDGPRGRGRPAGSTGGGGARLKGTHVAKHVMKNREKEVDEAGFGDYEPEQGTGKFDKRTTSTGTVYTRKPETYVDVNDPDQKSASDGPRGRGRPAGSTGGGGARLKGTHVAKHVMKNREKEVDEGDVEDFVADGGKITKVPPNKAPHRPGMGTASKHIGGGGDKEKASRTGRAANTQGKPIVAVEGGADCPHCGQAMPHGAGREVDMESAKEGMGHFVKAAKKVGGVASAVKKAKKDYDGDGKIETGPEEHAGSVDKAIKANKDKPKAKKTEEGAKPDFIDADKDGDKKEPMKKAFKDKKEKKVEETTTGSVATSSSGKSSGGGGMTFGGSIYDSWERKYSNLLKEDVNVSTNSSKDDSGEEVESITINVSGDDVARIKEMLHNMGVGHGSEAGHEHDDESCDTCGGVPCQCDDMEEGTVGAVVGGTAGAALGAATPIPGGAMIGRAIGSALGDKVTGESDEMDESAAPFKIGDKVVWKYPSGRQVRGEFKGMKDGVDALIYSHPNTYAIPLSNLQPDQGDQGMEEGAIGAGVGGAAGAALGAATPIPGGAMIGRAIGSALGDKVTGESDEMDEAGHQRMMELAGLGEANVTYSNNEPDYPSNQEETNDALQYSGGLNDKKSTGQATLPVVASQVRRLHSHVSEGQAMMDLYKAIAAIENKEV